MRRLLSLLLLVPCPEALAAPVSAPLAPDVVAPEIRHVLDAMGPALSAAPRLSTTARTLRRLEAEGFVQEVACDFQLGIERPNRLSLRHGRGVYCETTVSDGQKLFVYEPSHGHYFTRPAPADLETVLEESGAQEAPGLGMLAGLLSRDPVAWLLDGVTHAKEAAAETHDGVALRRFDFVQEDLDWSLWLEARPPHWPRRVEERSSAGSQYPKSTTMRTTLDLGRWEAGPIAADVFHFVPPDGVAEASHGEEGADAAAVGKPAPALRFTTLADGSEVSLAALRGKVVVLELWASWCEPCVRALPELQEAAKALAGTEVVFLAVNQGEDASTARAFLETQKTLGEPVRFVLDEASTAGEQLGADGIPYAVVIDKEGIIRAAHAGYSPVLVRQLRTDIDKALGER
jgi:thiol-disulfide isomerase/thioredoxin